MSREDLDGNSVIELESRTLEEIVAREERYYIGNREVELYVSSNPLNCMISLPFCSEELTPEQIVSKVVESCVIDGEADEFCKAKGFVIEENKRKLNYGSRNGLWEAESVSYHTKIRFYDYEFI